jgi:hypothetical protein
MFRGHIFTPLQKQLKVSLPSVPMGDGFETKSHKFNIDITFNEVKCLNPNLGTWLIYGSHEKNFPNGTWG